MFDEDLMGRVGNTGPTRIMKDVYTIPLSLSRNYLDTLKLLLK